MSGKFIRVRRIVIPVIAAVILISQLIGCAAMSSQEMLEMIDQGQTIELIVNQPDKPSVSLQGEKQQEVDWIQLDQLKTHNKGFRQGVDEIFNIRIITNEDTGVGSKNGVLYIINVDGVDTQSGNTSLYSAFRNKVFINQYWSKSDVLSELSELASEVYTDIDASSPYAIQAVLNAYYNLLNDHENPDAFYPTASVNREEFYTLMLKASSGVKNINSDIVDAYIQKTGSNTEYSEFAALFADKGWLDIDNKSLDSEKLASTISRAEAVYMIVNTYFSDELAKVSDKAVAFSDNKNLGNLSVELGFATKNADGTITEKPQCEAYTLMWMLQQPNKGMHEDLYKAMVVAKEYGILDGSESRWDEGLTRSEAIDLMINTFEALNKRDGFLTKEEYGIVKATDPEIIEKGENIVEDATKVEVTYTLADLTKTQLEYFEAIVELEKPVEYVMSLIRSGGSETHINYYVDNTLRLPAKEYVVMNLLPINGAELFGEWFKSTDEYKEIQSMIKDIDKIRAEIKAEQDKQNQQEQQQEQQQQQAQQEQIVYKYLLSDVKMRVSPDINSEHYGILPAGTQLTFKKVTDVKYKDGYWVLVTYKHQLNPNLEIYVADSWISDDPNAYINYNQAQEVKPQPSVQQQGQQIEDTNKNPSQQGQTGTQQGQQGGQQQAQAPSFMPQGSNVFTGNYYNEMVAKYGEAGAQDLVSRAQKVYYDIAALPQAEQTKLLEDVKNIDTTLAYTRADGSHYDTNRVKEWLKVVTLPNGENVLNYGERGKVLWVDPNGRGSISYNTNSGCIGTNFINNDGTTSRWDDACYGSQDIKDALDALGGRVGSRENTNY